MDPEISIVTERFFYHLGPFFAILPTLTAQKMKISKKWKQHLAISSFYTSVPKFMTIGYTVLEIWHVTDMTVVFILVNFLPFYPPPPNIQKNENFKKNLKNNGDIIMLHKIIPKLMNICYTVPEICCVMATRRFHHFTQLYQKL